MVKRFDPKCYELAVAFIADALTAADDDDYRHQLENDLAMDIQQVVEDFLEAEKL